MIDEKRLIGELRKYADELGTVRGEIELANGVLKAISIIKSQPKVGEWIPCSDRLPKQDECVLVSYRSFMVWDKDIYSDKIAIIREDGWHWWDELETKIENEIIAWQPLPEPYEVKENERP